MTHKELRKKVLEGIAAHRGKGCVRCPYEPTNGCMRQLLADAETVFEHMDEEKHDDP